MTKLKETVRVSRKKIVNIATNKAIITFAIFFYLALILIKAKEKNYGQAIEHGNDFVNILINAGPMVAVAAAPIAEAATASAAAASTTAAAAPEVAAGLEAANAANTAGNVAKGVDTANKGVQVAKEADAANKGVQAARASVEAPKAPQAPPKSAPTVKAAETKNTPHLNTEQAVKKPDNRLDSNASKFKDKVQKMDDLRQQVESDKKNKNRLNEETEETADQETEMDVATKTIVGKLTLTKLLLIGFFSSLAVTVVIIIIITAVTPYIFVSPISTIMQGVSNYAQTVGEKVGGVLERLKNAIFLRGFRTDEKILYDEITKEYDKYLNTDFSVEIDIPLIAATLFYDIQSVDQGDRDSDKLPDTDPRILDRVKYVPDVAALQVQRFESKFMCTKETVGEATTYKKVFISTYPLEVGPERTTYPCTEETAGQEIFEYRFELDLDNYYTKLKDSGILEKVYGAIASTEAKKNSLISSIRSSRDLWVMLYQKLKKELCPSSGTLPSEFLKEMQPPVKAPYTITSYFGYRTGQFAGFHTGIDVVPSSVVNIYPAAPGKVVRVYKESAGGNVINISHTINGVNYVTQYAHLADNSITVTVGQEITEADIGNSIAVMGATGNVSGPHLHFQVWREGLIPDGSYNPIVDKILNPVNLFEAASNYIYECRSKTSQSDCSLLGSVASIAQEKGYNFNILRAIIEYESSGSNSDVLTVGFKNVDLKERLEASTSSKAASVAALINFDNSTVNMNGVWMPYASSAAQVARNEVVQLVGSVNENAYLDVAMGNGQILGKNYSGLGYSSAKEMYEDFSNSKYAQVKGMITYLERQGSKVIAILKNIGSIIDSELSGAVQTLVEAYRPGGPETWKAKVLEFYRKFRDDPNSKIETYINECGFSVADVGWTCHFKVKRYCNPSESVKNFVNNLKNSTALSPRQRTILEPALSLWLKVNYCGHDKSTYNYCSRGGFARIGVDPQWQYDSKGLDCGDYVTWVMNQAFKTKSTPYVLNNACHRDSSWSDVTDFGDGNIGSVAADMKAGDVVCDKNYPERHVMIYLGYEDKNDNGRPDGRDLLYFIHSSWGDNGVIVTSDTISGLSRLNSYFTYTK